MVSKTELKKRQKARQNEEKKKKKEEEKAKKEAEKAEKAKAEGKEAPVKVEEILDPTKYRENRQQWLQSIRDKGQNPYPHKFNRTIRIDQFCAKYESHEGLQEKGAALEDVIESITGRIMKIRESGAKLIFIDLVGDESKV